MFTSVLMTCLVAMATAVWQNDFDQPLQFTCPSGQAITGVKSEHNNGAEDRRFDFTCSPLPVDMGDHKISCQWTVNYVNEFDQPVFYECPDNKFMSGMESVHSNGAEDRKWKYYCCSYPTVHLYDCELTGWTNTLDQPQNYQVPSGMLIKGAYSVHDNGAEDRQYEYDICHVSVSDGGESIVG